jgi:plasmid stabilization system protein ParE
MARLVWKPVAVDALEKIVRNRLANVGAVAARTVREEIIGRVNQLRDFPERGRRIPEKNDPSLRELIVPPYRIPYRLSGGTVTVLNIVRGHTFVDDDLGQDV